MRKLTILDNPSREEVVEYFLNTTVHRACRLFITEPVDTLEQGTRRFIMNLLQENGLIATRRAAKESFYVKDFLFKRDHDKAVDIICNSVALEAHTKECVDTYSDFVTFLNDYLSHLLRSYGHEAVDEPGSL